MNGSGRTLRARGVERIIVGTYTANYNARQALEKGCYLPSANLEAFGRVRRRKRYRQHPDALAAIDLHRHVA